MLSNTLMMTCKTCMATTITLAITLASVLLDCTSNSFLVEPHCAFESCQIVDKFFEVNYQAQLSKALLTFSVISDFSHKTIKTSVDTVMDNLVKCIEPLLLVWDL